MRGLKLQAVLLSLVALVSCERYALDRTMEELCNKDGGMRIHEKVVLPASEFSNVGQPLAKYQQQAKSPEDQLGPDYRYIVHRTVVAGHADAKLERGEGRVTRVYERVVRRADSRILGENVWYVRGGGDGFTFGFEPSSSYCPTSPASLVNSIFMKE